MNNLHTLYIDPSVMSYTIEIIAGAVITLGAIFGIVFRKVRKKAKDVLNIEEKKEFEDDIIDLSDSESNENEQG